MWYSLQLYVVKSQSQLNIGKRFKNVISKNLQKSLGDNVSALYDMYVSNYNK